MPNFYLWRTSLAGKTILSVVNSKILPQNKLRKLILYTKTRHLVLGQNNNSYTKKRLSSYYPDFVISSREVQVCLDIQRRFYSPQDNMGSGSSKKGAETTSPSASPNKSPAAKSPASPSKNETSPQKDTGSSVDPPLPPLKETPDEPVEAVVCSYDDLKDGEMREVEVGQGKVLLVREHGEYSALGAKCTHFGAPLVKGALCNGRVRCPWHGACFNTKTGDIEDYPGLDSLPIHDVEIQENKVVIKTTKKSLSTNKRVKQMSCWSPEVEKTFVIIGGGAAAIACAETLRQEGFKGEIVMATKEKDPPYDRTKLSKALASTGQSLALRDKNFFSVYDIQVQTEKEAISVDTMLNAVGFKDGSSCTYDALMIATGGRPRTLDCPGSDLQNVCYLRTPEDGNFIASHAKGKKVVIIGNSFIGMEVAAFLVGKASSVTVLGRSKVAFQFSLGEKIGEALQKMHEDKGVKFIHGSASEFIGYDGKLREVVVQNGEKIPADICVVGAGVLPATDFVKTSGLDMTSAGHLIVDQCMKTSQANVFAAGDIVQFPLFTANQNVNIGHWQMAHAHGRIAALNMLDQDVELHSVPFFWTMMFGKSLRYAGHGAGYDDIILHGDVEALDFIAYYIKEDKVIAVATMNSDPVASQVAELMNAGKTITKDDIMENPKGFEYKF